MINKSKKIKIIKGKTVTPGKISGKVRIINSKKDLEDLKFGDVMVASIPPMVCASAAKRVCAVIFDSAGLNSHIVIACREYKIPCIINAKNATKILSDGQTVEIDADRGIIKIIE